MCVLLRPFLLTSLQRKVVENHRKTKVIGVNFSLCASSRLCEKRGAHSVGVIVVSFSFSLDLVAFSRHILRVIGAN